DATCRLLEHESHQLTVALGEAQTKAVAQSLGRLLQISYALAVTHRVAMPEQLRSCIRPPMTTAESVRAVIQGCPGGPRSRLVLGLVTTVASVHRSARSGDVRVEDVVRALHRAQVSAGGRIRTRAVYGAASLSIAGPTARS
ncbi:MAG TPA: hypothetical protein VKG43_04890, partial [Acidimicrobiales bacterium]|nr:hypothetical protein [Acidimicrobiales bacterium]